MANRLVGLSVKTTTYNRLLRIKTVYLKRSKLQRFVNLREFSQNASNFTFIFFAPKSHFLHQGSFTSFVTNIADGILKPLVSQIEWNHQLFTCSLKLPLGCKVDKNLTSVNLWIWFEFETEYGQRECLQRTQTIEITLKKSKCNCKILTD